MKLAKAPAAFALGLATAYFLDRRDGTRRRRVLRDRLLKALRRARALVARRSRYHAGQARGLVHEARTGIVEQDVPSDDATVKQRIMSDAFREVQIRTSEVDVDVADGVVTLRGHLPSKSLADDLVARVRDVPGVRGVESALAVSEPA